MYFRYNYRYDCHNSFLYGWYYRENRYLVLLNHRHLWQVRFLELVLNSKEGVQLRLPFDFLELDESQFITESMVEKTASFSRPYIENPFCCRDYPSFKDYFYGGYYMKNNHKSHQSQAQSMLVTTPTVEAVPSTLPAVKQAQDLPVSTSANDTVPTLVGATGNCYPNTNVVLGPIFRIKGNQNSNFAGLDFLVEKTTAYAYEHLPKDSDLALAMQEYGQRTGHPSNVSVIGSPIFEIDTTAPAGSEYDDAIDADWGMFK